MASARTFTSDIYAQMLDNPTLSGDQRLAIQRMQADARGARSKDESEYRAYMKSSPARASVLSAETERQALSGLQGTARGFDSGAATQEMALDEAAMAAQLGSVQDEIEALKASLGLSEAAKGARVSRSRVPAKYKDGFAALTQQSVDQQAKSFLMAFVYEFQGRFEEILGMAVEFTSFLREGAVELEEDQAHRFLHARGETCTIMELRTEMRTIDIDMDNKMAFIEYLFYKYAKTLQDFFEPPPGQGPPPPHLVKALNEAIEWHTKHWARRHERDGLYSSLEHDMEGDSRVKALRARARLQAERSDHHWTQQWRAEEIHGAFQARKAEKAVKNADHGAMMREAHAEEERRLKKAEEDMKAELAKKRKAARARLAAKAALWEGRS